MSTITDKQTNDLENILDAIDQDNKREDNVSENKGKPIIDDVDDLSVESSVMGSLPLVMTVTKVIDLCYEGDVVTTSIENEFGRRKIPRELCLMVNRQKVNFELKKSVPDLEDLRIEVKKTIDDNLKLGFIKYA